LRQRHPPEETRPAPKLQTRTAPARPARSAAEAARAFAEAWTNWNWRTIRSSERRRARLAAGALRREIDQDAASVSPDSTLRRDRTENTGVVLAVALGDAGGQRSAYVIVRETTASAGLVAIGDTAVRVYRAQLVRAHGGWLVGAWAPLA
jgi:hypothetical protein